MSFQKTITIPGKPIPLARPRFSCRSTYDLQTQLKNDVSFIIKSQISQPPTSKLVSLKIHFFMPIPKNLPPKKTELLECTPHRKRPDLDNLVKFYIDVCNGLIYNDDSQIFSITAAKFYSKEPRTVMFIAIGDDNA